MTVVGDFNVDMFRGQRMAQRHHLEDVASGYSLTNHVLSPTRITPLCPQGSTIDLVLSTENSVSPCMVVPSTISDHFTVRATMTFAVQTKKCVRAPPTRKLHKIDIPLFREDLKYCFAQDFPSDADVDTYWELWYDRFMTVLDTHAPLVQEAMKSAEPVPWSNRDIYQLDKKKKRYHRLWLADKGNVQLHQQYRKVRTQATNMYRRCRNEYFARQCQEHSRNPRQIWKVINTVTGRGKQKTEPTCNIEEVANVFHDIVTDPKRPSCLASPVGPLPSDSLHTFQPASCSVIYRLLSQVNPAKATGSDSVPGFLLKSCAEVLTPSVTTLFNLSLKSGAVPAGFKLAAVSPLFKSGDPSQPTNYGPVSLLPILSKLLEKLVQRQLVRHLDHTDAIPETQFAFRRQHSTGDALALLVDQLQMARDKKDSSEVCFLDMSKAFDKVRHAIMIQDCFEIGVGGTVMKWLVS